MFKKRLIDIEEALDKLIVTTGRIFYVMNTTDEGYSDFVRRSGRYLDGAAKVYNTIGDALNAAVAGRGDVIGLSVGYTTALSAAELLSAETKGVTIIQAGKVLRDGSFFSHRATAALPQTTQSALFTVTGRIELVSIIGEITTVVQTQANNTKIVSNPTVGADVDLCANLDITAAAVGSQFHITGTLATAMVKTASGAFVKQASPVIVTAGTIDLACAASNTGSVKWMIIYKSIDPGARVFAA